MWLTTVVLLLCFSQTNTNPIPHIPGTVILTRSELNDLSRQGRKLLLKNSMLDILKADSNQTDQLGEGDQQKQEQQQQQVPEQENEERFYTVDTIVSAPRGSIDFTFERIIKDDERRRVKNTTDYPFNAIGWLGIGCTGTVIGPRHILTAAHCVYDIQQNKYFSPESLEFSVALNGNYTEASTKQPMKLVLFPQQWQDSGLNGTMRLPYDYAVVFLQNDISEHVQQVVPLSYSHCGKKIPLNTVGYPEDKGNGKHRGREMWGSACQNVTVNCESLRFLHNCDTVRGMSGSGMFVATRKESGELENTIVAVHSGFKWSDNLNEAVAITQDVWTIIQTWLDLVV